MISSVKFSHSPSDPQSIRITCMPIPRNIFSGVSAWVGARAFGVLQPPARRNGCRTILGRIWDEFEEPCRLRDKSIQAGEETNLKVST